MSGQHRSWLFPRRMEGTVSAVTTRSPSTKPWMWTSIPCLNRKTSLPLLLEVRFSQSLIYPRHICSYNWMRSPLPIPPINTHQGLYCYNRLPFGVASAPALFQKMMDTVLRGIPGVICYIDDILVSGKDEESHLRSLAEVFKRLEQHNFRLKQEKCEFLLTSVEYLGHRIGKDGIHAGTEEQDRCYRQRPSTSECAGTQVLPRPAQLLWQVYP